MWLQLILIERERKREESVNVWCVLSSALISGFDKNAIRYPFVNFKWITDETETEYKISDCLFMIYAFET